MLGKRSLHNLVGETLPFVLNTKQPLCARENVKSRIQIWTSPDIKNKEIRTSPDFKNKEIWTSPDLRNKEF